MEDQGEVPRLALVLGSGFRNDLRHTFEQRLPVVVAEVPVANLRFTLRA